MSNEFSEGELNRIKSFTSPNTTSYYRTVESDITKTDDKEYLETFDLFQCKILTSFGKVDPYISNNFSEHNSFKYSTRHICTHEKYDVIVIGDSIENIKVKINELFENDIKYRINYDRIFAYQGSLFIFDIIPSNIVVEKHKYVKINDIEHTLSTTKNVKKYNVDYVIVDSLFEYNNTIGEIECEYISKELTVYYETLRKDYKENNLKEISRKIKLYDDDWKQREMKEKLDKFNELKKELNL